MITLLQLCETIYRYRKSGRLPTAIYLSKDAYFSIKHEDSDLWAANVTHPQGALSLAIMDVPVHPTHLLRVPKMRSLLEMITMSDAEFAKLQTGLDKNFIEWKRRPILENIEIGIASMTGIDELSNQNK